MTPADPPMETLLEEQRRIEKAGRLHTVHWLIIGASLVLTLTAWYFTAQQVHQKTLRQFERQSTQVIGLISERLQKYENTLRASASFIPTQNDLSYEEWKNYANSLNIDNRYPGINGVGVIYYVPEARREAFIEEQRQIYPDFEIYPPHEQGEYWPITFIEPLKINKKAVGLDMAHESNRYTAAKAARDTGTPQITGPITLVQDAEQTPGFLLFVPFYNAPVHQVTDRRALFVGHVYAPFIVNKLMQGTLARQTRLIDIRISDGDTVLYDELTGNHADFDPQAALKTTIPLEIYGRTWDFTIRTTKSFHQENHNAKPFFILASGLIIEALLITLFILLARANRKAIRFANDMAENYQNKANDLEAANMELEEFAWRTSHDLRSPLTSCLGLLKIAKNAIEKGEDDKAEKSISYAQNSIEILKTLIEDIIDLTKTKKLDEEIQDVVPEKMINEALHTLKYMEGRDRLDIQLNLRYNDSVAVRKMRLKMIIENLVSNAIKYQDPEKPHPYVNITTEAVDNVFVLRVEDNGLGIPEQQRDKVFSMFKRFHPNTSYGSGLGLYMMRKSADILGGEINYQDNGQGSTFTLVVPLDTKLQGEVL